MPASQQDLERVLEGLAQRRPSLALDTLDLGFLIALFVRAHGAQLSSFSEAGLGDVYEQVCAALEPAAEQRKKRATYAIARLREQRLLARVDGHGVVRSGEYALTRLATGIVEFFLDEDVLTRESLSLLTATLRTTLESIRQVASSAVGGPPEVWAQRVTGPLEVTIAELVAGIERRQRGLDLRQEAFQSEIRRLLQADWFGAIERCQALLESTSATLRELNEVLLRDTSLLLELLHDIEDLALESSQPLTAAAAVQMVEHVDRIAAWGGSRQRAFSEYFQYVHRYLRDVVRLDPTRALTQRLREQLAGSGPRFALTLAGAPPIRLLRSVLPEIERPPVTRPRGPREREPARDAAVDAQAELEQRVAVALEAGADSLARVTDAVNAQVPDTECFVTAGRVAQATASLARVRAARERHWVVVHGALEIEDWRVFARGAETSRAGE